MTLDPFRVYLDPADIGPDGYPHLWNATAYWNADIGVWEPTFRIERPEGKPYAIRPSGYTYADPIKDQIRERDGHRCLRCKHPYEKGQGEWSACDEQCEHVGPIRWHYADGTTTEGITEYLTLASGLAGWRDFEECREQFTPEAQWRILTVHHLNGVKHDCRWWNLVSLCQRCHLTIQAKVHLARSWSKPHSEWFRPFVAGYYAWALLGEELSRDETMARLDELLALEQTQYPLF